MLNLEVPSMWKNGAQSAVSLAPRQKRENFDISFENDTKVKRKWLKNLNLKSETKVLLEETMEKLKKKNCFNAEEAVSSMIQMPAAIKQKWLINLTT